MSTAHRPYIHKEASESSLRCTCGAWKGTNLVDNEGHLAHIVDRFRAEAVELAARPTDTRPHYQNEPEGA